MADITGVVKNCILFSGVEPATLERILALPGQRAARFSAGDEVPVADANGRQIGILLSGKVRVEKDSADSHTFLMRQLFPAQVFGVAALFQPGERMSRLIAEETTDILLVSREAVLEMFRLEPRIMENYMAYLSDRIAFLNKKIQGLSGYNARSRLILYFLDHAVREGKGGRLELPIHFRASPSC